MPVRLTREPDVMLMSADAVTTVSFPTLESTKSLVIKLDPLAAV